MLCYAVPFTWCLVDKLNAWIMLPSIVTIYSVNIEMSLDHDPMKIGHRVEEVSFMITEPTRKISLLTKENHDFHCFLFLAFSLKDWIHF